MVMALEAARQLGTQAEQSMAIGLRICFSIEAC